MFNTTKNIEYEKEALKIILVSEILRNPHIMIEQKATIVDI